MAQDIDALKEKLKNGSGNSERVDRGIKGTLVDDYIVEYLIKSFCLFGILVLGCSLYIMLEKAVTVRTLLPYRASVFTIGWTILCFRQSKFLRFGLWECLATLTVIVNLSQFYREFMLNTLK